MRINHVEIANFRALEKVAVPLQQFSVLLGENDVGKTTFLYALEKFFAGKKFSDPKDWYRRDTGKPVCITVTFGDLPDDDQLRDFMRNDGTIAVRRVFKSDMPPETKAILDDSSAVDIPKTVLSSNFSENIFHFVPVRRDLTVQFSMNKTALLGKLLRAKMKKAIADARVEQPISEIQKVLQDAIDMPRISMEGFLKEQLNNDSIKLGFEGLKIDPTEGVSFDVTLSDDQVTGISIQDRGAGTQNNLILALFRLIAQSDLEGEFILAMEEPENSLHPKAQRQLLGVIQEISNSNQVIVTTHSPVFIDRSRYESNIFLTRKSAGNTVAKIFQPEDIAQIRTDLGIRASDALLKGGGNCAILVEGSTEEYGFPLFMEMMGLSDFDLGIAIVKMGGSDFPRARNIVQLLGSYDIPSVVVLDRDAKKTADDLNRMKGDSLKNLREVFLLQEGTIEDYYPEHIVAEVINREFSPHTAVTTEELMGERSGQERLDHYKKIMYDHGAGSSLEYLKSALGHLGTRMLKENGEQPHKEIQEILRAVEGISRET